MEMMPDSESSKATLDHEAIKAAEAMKKAEAFLAADPNGEKDEANSDEVTFTFINKEQFPKTQK